MSNSKVATSFDFLRLFRLVHPIVFAFNLLPDDLHLLNLLVPLSLAHLELFAEKLIVRLAITATNAIPQRRELAVVVVEVQMVHSVAGSAVDDRIVSVVFAVVDQDGPDIDEDEENDVGEFLQREYEGESMVGETLRVTVEGMEGVRGIWSRHNPLVVRLVQVPVDERVVQASVDPVDAEIGEGDEEGELNQVPPPERCIIQLVV